MKTIKNKKFAFDFPSTRKKSAESTAHHRVNHGGWSSPERGIQPHNHPFGGRTRDRHRRRDAPVMEIRSMPIIDKPLGPTEFSDEGRVSRLAGDLWSTRDGWTPAIDNAKISQHRWSSIQYGMRSNTLHPQPMSWLSGLFQNFQIEIFRYIANVIFTRPNSMNMFVNHHPAIAFELTVFWAC